MKALGWIAFVLVFLDVEAGDNSSNSSGLAISHAAGNVSLAAGGKAGNISLAAGHAAGNVSLAAGHAAGNVSLAAGNNSSFNSSLAAGNVTEGKLSFGMVWNVVLGTTLALGGSGMQPIILILNGLITSQAPQALHAFGNELKKGIFSDTLAVSLVLSTIAGFGVATCAIQNANFESALQGGVLFASAYSQNVRPDFISALGNTSLPRVVQDTVAFGADGVITGIGSSLALAFRMLLKLLNSSWLSSGMVVAGWLGIIKAGFGWSVQDTKWPWFDGKYYEYGLSAAVTLFLFWWHSKIESMQKAKKWKKRVGRSSKVKLKGFFRRMMDRIIGPVMLSYKMLIAMSETISRSANLKSEPRTTREIIEEVAQENDIFSLGALVIKAVAAWGAQRVVRNTLKPSSKAITAGKSSCASKTSKTSKGSQGNKVHPSDVEGLLEMADKMPDPSAKGDDVEGRLEMAELAVQLTTVLFSALDVEDIQRIVYTAKAGDGDFTTVLEDQFDDVLLAIRESDMPPLSEKTDEELAEIWQEAKMAIMSWLLEKQKQAAIQLLRWSKMLDSKVLQEWAANVINGMSLEEATTVIRQLQQGTFVFDDLYTIAENVAKREQQKLALVDVPTLVEVFAAEASVEPSSPSLLPAAQAGRSLRCEAQHSSPPPDIIDIAPQPAELGSLLSDNIKAMVKARSDSLAVKQLATCVEGMIQLGEPLYDVCLIGPIIRWCAVSAEEAIDKIIAKVPFLGPWVRTLLFGTARKLKISLITKAIREALKFSGIPEEKVSNIVRKFASMDDYLDDAFQELFEPPPESGKHQKNNKRRVFVALQKAIQDKGPGRCLALLKLVIVDFLEVDLKLAKNFLAALTPNELMDLARPLLQGKFDFGKATKLARMKTSIITFTVKTGPQFEKVDDKKLSFRWSSPPCLLKLDEDWASDMAKESETDVPSQLDNLQSVGGNPATYMAKDTFEQLFTEKDSAWGDFVLKFRRGLDIDFSQRFRDKIPSMLRKRMGVPFDESRALARAMTSDHMQKLMRILLFGGMKTLEDLSEELQVKVNWENAIRDNVKTELVKSFGFTTDAADTFSAGLANSKDSFVTRISQLLGFSTLSALQTAIFLGNMTFIEKIHARVYKPRHSLVRTLFYDDNDGVIKYAEVVEKSPKIRLTEDGEFAMIRTTDGKQEALQSDQKVTRVVLETWRSLIFQHIDDTGPLTGFRAFHKDHALQLAEALAKSLEVLDEVDDKLTSNFSLKQMKASVVQRLGTWDPVAKYTWPTDGIKAAVEAVPGTTNIERKVAENLFNLAVCKTCQGTFDMYDGICITKAIENLGMAVSEFATEEEMQQKDDFDVKLSNWMQKLIDGLDGCMDGKTLQRGSARVRAVKRLERALEEVDTFTISKMARAHGVTDPLPLEGVQSQLKLLSKALPFDLVSKADAVSNYQMNSQHPLNGVISTNDGGAKPSSPSLLPAAQAVHSSPPRSLRCEAQHSSPPPEHRPGGGDQQPPVAPRFKEVFALARGGDFGKLAEFAKASGEQADPTAKMCSEFAVEIVKRFGVPKSVASGAIYAVLPATHKTKSAMVTFKDPWDEYAEGGAVEKDVRVVVAPKLETEELEVNGMVYVARPVKGWLPIAELMEIELSPLQEVKKTQKVGDALCSLQKYDLIELQHLSDDFVWNWDFRKLAVQRVNKFVQLKAPIYTSPQVVEASKGLNDSALRAVLTEMDRGNLDFIIDALMLPKPKRKPKAGIAQATIPMVTISEEELKGLKTAKQGMEKMKRAVKTAAAGAHVDEIAGMRMLLDALGQVSDKSFTPQVHSILDDVQKREDAKIAEAVEKVRLSTTQANLNDITNTRKELSQSKKQDSSIVDHILEELHRKEEALQNMRLSVEVIVKSAGIEDLPPMRKLVAGLEVLDTNQNEGDEKFSVQLGSILDGKAKPYAEVELTELVELSKSAAWLITSNGSLLRSALVRARHEAIAQRQGEIFSSVLCIESERCPGTFLDADGGGKVRHTGGDPSGEWAQWRINPMGGGAVNIESVRCPGQYLDAFSDDDGKKVRHTAGDPSGSWAKFKPVYHPDGAVSFESVLFPGHYLDASTDAVDHGMKVGLTAGDTSGSWARWNTRACG